MGKRKNKKGRVPRSSVKEKFEMYGDCPRCGSHFEVIQNDLSYVFCPSCGASVLHLYSDFQSWG
ncbi:hypothetical protein ES703_52907 [subsurface metagenome]